MNTESQYKKLGKVTTIISGQSPEGRFYNHSGDGLPFYQGKKEFTEKFLGEPTVWTQFSTKIAEKGDILMSVRAPVGPVNFATQKICIGRGLAAIRVSEGLDENFLFYFLHMNGLKFSGNNGAVFPSINKSQIADIQIPLPPLPEQQRIVKILDEAFEAIEKAKESVEKNLRNASRINELQIGRIFQVSLKTSEVKNLGDIAVLRNGVNFTKGSKGKVVKIVGVKDFQKSFWISFKDLETVTLDGDLSEIDLLKLNDILVVRSNGNPALIGRSILAGEVIGDVTHSGFTIRVRATSDGVDAQYLCHFLKSQTVRELLAASGSGISIKSLNQGALSSLGIPLPSLSQQRSIVARLDSLSAETKKLEAIYQRKLACLDELKKSLLQKAFAGEL